MERYLGQPDGLDDPALVTERVLDEARRAFASYDPEVLEHLVRKAVNDLWGDSIRVTNFVPVLAMRQIREVVLAGRVNGAEPALVRIAEPVAQLL